MTDDIDKKLAAIAEVVADDDKQNNLVCTGAVLASLQAGNSLTREGGTAEPVIFNGDPINVIVVTFPFLKSRYRLTVERMDDDENM